MINQFRGPVFGAIALLIALPSFAMADDDPGGMSDMLLPPENIVVEDAGTEKWFVYRAEEDGVLIVLVHDSNQDLVMEAYPEAWSNGALGRMDRDIGNSGNEMVALEVETGKVYYIKILPYTSGNSLPQQFKVMSAFVPGGDFQTPFLMGGQGAGASEEAIELELDTAD